MSTSWVEFFSLDADEREASRRVDEVIEWLLATKVIARAQYADPLIGAYREGENFAEAVDPNGAPEGTVAGQGSRLFGVRVEKGWQISSNGDGYGDPPCPRCAVPLPTDIAVGFLGPWWESRIEPIATCPQCGHQGLLGDWPHEYFCYGNYGSVSFVNGPPLAERFENDVLQRFGGRPRKLYVHM